ncbi:endolytic transglycosylase MltG [Candidatus Berkelbacteria bacterium]|nr:endolytic transglycosylase MltG [Candidatus Berkelbacteria bacterium]
MRAKTKLVLVFGLAILALLSSIFLLAFFKPFQAKGSKTEFFFEVKKSETVFQIAQNLKDKKFLPATWPFILYTTFKNYKLKTGLYYLDQNWNFAQIAAYLNRGLVAEKRITIPEGFSFWQIGEVLEREGVLKKEEWEEKAREKEGFLFPDTYRFKAKATVEEVVSKMEENFSARTAALKPSREQVVLASIVEREAKKDEDRAKIAGVFQNRLQKNMFLEADPTVQYGKGNWEPITKADYTVVKSSYNTYLNKGLPPGPIANPGLSSLEAAIKPAAVPYFYFFHLKDGSTIYSKTEAEHNQNKKKYAKEISG